MNEKNLLNPNDVITQAVHHHQKNNFKLAEKLYKQILKSNPNHLDAIFYLGSLSVQIKNFEQGKNLLEKLIKAQPNHATGNTNLGIVYVELGKPQEAIEYFKNAIKNDPYLAIAYFNLGNVFHKLNKFHEAIEQYKKTIDIDSNHILAHNNMAISFIELDMPLEAIKCCEKAITLNQNYTLAVNNISILFKETHFTNLSTANSSSLRKLLLMLFRRNDINHKDIFRNAKTLLFLENKNSQLEQVIYSKKPLLSNRIILDLLKNELFLLMMQKSLMADQLMEKMLSKLRFETILNLINNNKNVLEKNLDFIISLAEQCFLNEYVFFQSAEETKYVNTLESEISNSKKIDELKIAVLGAYKPLRSNEYIINKLSNYESKNQLFNDFLNMQIRDPLKEKKLIDSIKSLEKISDNVSNKVRVQYEEYPYPRWRYTYSIYPNHFLNFFTNQIKPNKIELKNNFNNPKVLIAGCGTGNHICQASNYLNANILAVDLSLTSLAYAKRKIEEFNIKNIDFLQADILQLKNLERKFDIVESVGVLHHMNDPVHGLKILRDLLEPDGLLLIGLYSEKARQEVIKAKEFVKKGKFKNTLNGIRMFREAIFNEKDDLLLKKISNGKDFYSKSSVKDLVFHEQEHRFNLLQISQILKDLNLEFLGFCNKKIKNQYKKAFPNDEKCISLSNWNKFEMLEPRTFTGMYNFWVRKTNK